MIDEHPTIRGTTSSIVNIIELDSPCQATLRHAASIERQGCDGVAALHHAIVESAPTPHIVIKPRRAVLTRSSVNPPQPPTETRNAAGGALANPTASGRRRRGSMASPLGSS